jgi:hypothetical protein
MIRNSAYLLLVCILISSCNSTKPITSEEPLIVHYTASTKPWLADVYACSNLNAVRAEERAADLMDPQSYDLAIRIGLPDNLVPPAFEIGSEDIVVILNLENPINNLTTDQVQGIFTGQTQNWQEINGSNAPVQAWVFPSGEDIQQIFEQSALGGSTVTSFARLAAGPVEMAQAIATDVNAIGFLSRRWKTGAVSGVYTIVNIPVLALTPVDPPEVVQEILACLQK